MILSAVPAAVVTGRSGRATSFEVTVNDTLIFSKLKLGSFPDFEDVVKSVEGVARGEPPEIINKCAKSSCVIT
jgi:selT/selW/selH-like putative selenoprotein